MKPLIVLVGMFALLSVLHKLFMDDFGLSICGRMAMCSMLLFTSVGHFVFVNGMAMMLPGFMPAKRAVIVITGIVEIAFGFCLLIPTIYHATAFLLVIFFVLILPANVLGAKQKVNLERANYEGSGLRYLWFRVPLQLFFIAWVWYFGIYS